MKRRGFFGALLGVCAVPVAAMVPKAVPAEIGKECEYTIDVPVGSGECAGELLTEENVRKYIVPALEKIERERVAAMHAAIRDEWYVNGSIDRHGLHFVHTSRLAAEESVRRRLSPLG